MLKISILFCCSVYFFFRPIEADTAVLELVIVFWTIHIILSRSLNGLFSLRSHMGQKTLSQAIPLNKSSDRAFSLHKPYPKVPDSSLQFMFSPTLKSTTPFQNTQVWPAQKSTQSNSSLVSSMKYFHLESFAWFSWIFQIISLFRVNTLSSHQKPNFLSFFFSLLFVAYKVFPFFSVLTLFFPLYNL